MADALPVDDVPALDGAALARAWLTSLIAAVPDEGVAALPGPGFAREAPLLCRAVADALVSDAALAGLGPGGARHGVAASTAVLAGARGPVATVAAIERLRAAAWELLLAELAAPTPELVARLAERLAAVCAVVTIAALQADHRRGRRCVAGEPGASDPSDRARVPLAAVPVPTLVRGRVEDLRTSPPWTGAIARQVAHHRADGSPFAVLCAELAELDRLVSAGLGDALAAALSTAERALRATLRRGDVLVSERPGRYWIVAPDTDEVAARALAELLAAAISGLAPHRGAPLRFAVGLAAAPVDAVEPAQLEARAEEGLFAARAAGVRVA